MKINIVLTTRGLVHTQVEHAIELMRQWHDVTVFRSWNLNIPDAQNILTEEALKKDCDYILYIEEDTIPPLGGLKDMLDMEADVAFIDYAINGWACAARYKDGEVLWCGLGCTLVNRKVFEKLEKPYFRTDKSLSLNEDTYFEWIDLPNKYGGQDIWFFSKVREAGFKLVQAPGECQHMKIDVLGMAGVNNGRHVLSQKPVIENQAIYEKPLTTSSAIEHNDNIGNNPGV